MAIYSSVPPPSQQSPVAQRTDVGVDIEAWTVSTLQSLSISPSSRSTGVTLTIPLDSDLDHVNVNAAVLKSAYKARQEPLRRDSQKRREALLKGKEGSRRRQRWENDRLLHVPNVQPPLPSDWEVRPTHPVHHVPYYLAPLWDSGMRRRAEETASAKKIHAAEKAGLHEQKGRVPQELRQKLKKSKGAKTLLQDLEKDVRNFVKDWEGKQKILQEAEEDSEDEEIVFVGRNGMTNDEQRKSVEEGLKREKMVFDSLADDQHASFGRWLVHSIAAYYGLSSRSITVGDPARREAYVAIKGPLTGGNLSAINTELPRPLWCMV